MCIHFLPSHSQYSDSSKKSDVMIVVCSKQALHSAAGAPQTRMIEKEQQIFDPMVLKWVEWLLSRTESIILLSFQGPHGDWVDQWFPEPAVFLRQLRLRILNTPTLMQTIFGDDTVPNAPDLF